MLTQQAEELGEQAFGLGAPVCSNVCASSSFTGADQYVQVGLVYICMTLGK